MAQSIFARLPLFADLSSAELADVRACMRRRRYARGSLIHASGAMGADLYIIESGRVSIQVPSPNGNMLMLRLLLPGDFFGEISLLDNEPWYGDAEAVDDCHLLLLAKQKFLEMLDTYPNVSRRLLVIVCRRLRHNTAFARDLAFLDVPTRLVRSLMVLAESEGWGWTGGRNEQETCLVDVTQATLAAHVGATRESINKWLGYYERRGILRRTKDGIVLLKIDELRALAGLDDGSA